eukprot:TRINITY_DN6683_c0_g1_i2.p1 TRINITY_DN6683_c0_g1~~TRINITY_DN6683_c0_g1_i2.p1  ORF type:complete len:255 (+),score=44.40 TRINITY_DN6683_c0_g1_i2:466-1230(+)
MQNIVGNSESNSSVANFMLSSNIQLQRATNGRGRLFGRIRVWELGECMKFATLLLLSLLPTIFCIMGAEDFSVDVANHSHSLQPEDELKIHKADCLEFFTLGTRAEALNKQFLVDHNLKRVLTVATEKEIPSFDERADGVTYQRVAIKDNGVDELTPHLDEAMQFLKEGEERHERTLIHCVEAKSRSPSLLIAYLMKEKGFSLKEAFQTVKNRYPQIVPRYQLMQELLDLEKTLYGKNSMSHEDNYVPIILGPP